MTTRLSASTWIYWLMLVSLSFELVASLSVADQEDEKVATGPKWQSDLENFLKEAQNGAGEAMDSFWRPKKEFLAAVQRWQRWYSGYSKLCDKRTSEKSGCLQTNEFLFSEYSKIDRDLFAERRQKEWKRAKLAGEQPEEGSIEQGDYLFELLGRLLDHLEAKQENLEHAIEPLPTSADKEALNGSMERLKRILLNSVGNLARGEGLELGRIVAFKLFAMILAQAPPAHGSPLSSVAPIIEMLGNANTPLLLHYLTNIKIRTIIGAFDGLNPVPLIYEQLAGKRKA